MSQSHSLDLIGYIHDLTEVGFTPRQAEVQAKKLSEIVEVHLATKKDVEALRQDLEIQTYKLTIRLGSMFLATASLFLAIVKFSG